MNSSAVEEVTAESHLDPLQRAVGFVDGKQIEQCLRRVLASTVPRIDDRDARTSSEAASGAELGVTDDDDVGIRRDHPADVFELLALLG